MMTASDPTQPEKATPKRERLPKLTDIQVATLVYIAEFVDADPCERSPTYRHLAIHFGISKSTAFERVEALRSTTPPCLVGEMNVSGTNEPSKAGRRIVERYRSGKTGATPHITRNSSGR
jgi:hypothetical protein